MALLTISGSVWAQAEKNMVTYTIDGGAFHHQLVNITYDSKMIRNGVRIRPGANYIKINLEDTSVSAEGEPIWFFNVAFNHLGTGTAKINDPITSPLPADDKQVNIRLGALTNGNTKYMTTLIPDHAPTLNKTSGKITITRFGPVQGTIEGTFECKLIDENLVIYTVTGGHFVVTRKS